MEDVSHLKLKVGPSRRNETTDRLARAHLNLRMAITKTKSKSDRKDYQKLDEKDVLCFQEQVALVCGESFVLTWSTEAKLRQLDSEGRLPKLPEVLTAYCRKHLKNKDCHSPWQLLLHFEWLGLEEQRSWTFKFLLRNFVDALEDVAYLTLPASVLLKLLSHPCLVLEREADAGRALLRWLHHSPDQRSKDVAGLLAHIHIDRLSREELVEMETVFRYLRIPLSATQRFQRRYTRFKDWVDNLGARIFLSLTRGHFIEISEFSASHRRWEQRISFHCPAFQTETLTGNIKTMIIVGDEDVAFIIRNGLATAELMKLCPEFLGPMTYRLVSGKLYAAQNQGRKIKLWIKGSNDWICLNSFTVSTWLYRIQLFANPDDKIRDYSTRERTSSFIFCTAEYLVIAGQRNVKETQESKDKPIKTKIFCVTEPFLLSYNIKNKTFFISSRFPKPLGNVQNIGATATAFWILHNSTDRIWMYTLGKTNGTWHETDQTFPTGDRILSSCCRGASLLILSSNIIRGHYLTLSILTEEPELRFTVVGSMAFDFPKSYTPEFLCAARFHLFSENSPCF